MIQAHLRAIWNGCDSVAHWLRLLRRLNRFFLAAAAAFATIKGRVRTRGLNGVLNYSKAGEPPKVSSKSKAYLADAMRLWRVAFFFIDREAFGEVDAEELGDAAEDEEGEGEGEELARCRVPGSGFLILGPWVSGRVPGFKAE